VYNTIHRVTATQKKEVEMSQVIVKIQKLMIDSDFAELQSAFSCETVSPSEYTKTLCKSLGFQSVRVQGESVYFEKTGIQVMLAFDSDERGSEDGAFYGDKGQVLIRVTLEGRSDNWTVKVVNADSKSEDEILEEVIQAIKKSTNSVLKGSKMNAYRIDSERRIVDEETIMVHSVVDEDGMPINHGHFSDADEAEYVRLEMESGRYTGDSVSDLSLSQSSYIQGV